MRIASFLSGVTVALGVALAAQGCSAFGGSEATKEDRLCTPGAYVFCRCADRTPGTKLCKDDGKSFAACTTDGAGECAGGEIEDPDTNKPIPPDEEPTDNPPGKSSALDACPGKSTAVPPGADVTLEGDTTGAKNDRKGKTGACAVGAGAVDHVYRLIPSGSGSLEVKVQGSEGLDPVAYLRSACDDEASQVSCAPTSPSKLVQLKLNVTTGKEYFLFVDGASSSSGKYVATVRLTTGSFCGDGKVDSGEACDDGNKVEGDGCSNDCKKVDGDPTSGGSCPGHPVHLWQGQTVTGAGSNASYGNTWSAPDQTCSASGTNTYSDHVYELTPHATGTITVTVTPKSATNLNLMLTARRACADPSSMGAGMCKNDFGVGTKTETLTLSATKDQKAYVAVDGGGITGNAGEYSVSFKLE